MLIRITGIEHADVGKMLLKVDEPLDRHPQDGENGERGDCNEHPFEPCEPSPIPYLEETRYILTHGSTAVKTVVASIHATTSPAFLARCVRTSCERCVRQTYVSKDRLSCELGPAIGRGSWRRIVAGLCSTSSPICYERFRLHVSSCTRSLYILLQGQPRPHRDRIFARARACTRRRATSDLT